MAEKMTHKCIICGTRYHSCDTCERIRTYTPWRTICDSFNHYEVYLALRAYEEGFDTKEQVRANLISLGVTKDTYRDWPTLTKQKLEKIFAEPKRLKRVKEEPALTNVEHAVLKEEIE